MAHAQTRHGAKHVIAVLKPLTIDAALTVCRNLAADERAVIEALSGFPFEPDEAAIAATLQSGMHWEFRSYDDTLLAVGGFVRQREGVFRTWFYALDAAWTRPYAQGLTELVADTIQLMFTRQLAHRIETVTLARQEKARFWYGKIGLEFESTLRGYCATGEDAVMYVALRDAEKI
jgi:RimJ/RimL family protein N-acetyltransferase